MNTLLLLIEVSSPFPLTKIPVEPADNRKQAELGYS
jgi:hypothetical protein